MKVISKSAIISTESMSDLSLIMGPFIGVSPVLCILHIFNVQNEPSPHEPGKEVIPPFVDMVKHHFVVQLLQLCCPFKGILGVSRGNVHLEDAKVVGHSEVCSLRVEAELIEAPRVQMTWTESG